jgi:hypothetical protein
MKRLISALILSAVLCACATVKPAAPPVDSTVGVVVFTINHVPQYFIFVHADGDVEAVDSVDCTLGSKCDARAEALYQQGKLKQYTVWIKDPRDEGTAL